MAEFSNKRIHGRIPYPGLHIQTQLRAGGIRKRYYYLRSTGQRIHGEPGTPEFDASYEVAKAMPVPLKWKTKTQHRPRVGGYVYFVQCVTLRHIKIGTSLHPWTRFLNIKTSCPDEVVLLGVIPHNRASGLEKGVQHRFAAHRIRGEWYRENDELLALIAEHAQPAPKVRVRHDFQDGRPQLVSVDRTPTPSPGERT